MAPSKKKKKPVSNPARGFATVSVPSTKSKIEISDGNDQSPNDTDAVSSIQRPEHAQNGVSTAQTGASGPGTENMSPEELEQHLEASELRFLVEKHGSRVKRDVSRQVKALETDRRLLRLSSMPLEGVIAGSEELITRVIDLVKHQLTYPAIPLPLPTTTSGLTSEMDLCLKVWTLYETLIELKFPHVDEVIKHILGHASIVASYPSSAKDSVWGLEESLHWYAVNVEENKLPRFERSQPTSSNLGTGGEELADELNEVPRLAAKQPGSSLSSSARATPANASDVSSSDSEDAADPPSVAQYVELQSRLLTIQNSVDTDSAAGPSLDSSREARKLSAKIGRIERDPLFDKKAADYEWRSRKRMLEIQAGQTRSKSKEATSNTTKVLELSETLSDGRQTDPPSANEDEGIGFSGLFELGDNLPDAESEGVPELTIRDFGKWSGTNPRKVLEDICKARDAGCRVNFKVVSSSFHSCRHQVDIQWSKAMHGDFPADMLLPETVFSQSRRRTSLTMKAIATPSTAQSEAFAATTLLFALCVDSLHGERPQVRLPTIWRHLYSDLVDRKSDYDMEQNVKRLETIRQLVREHITEIEARQTVIDKTKVQRTTESDPERLNGRGQSLQPAELQSLWNQKCSTQAYNKMLLTREQLPVYKQRSDFMEVFNTQQLMILCGETGSGKSTQTPALILENELSAGRDCRILCTQPRRISALSLASRVSEELGEHKSELGTLRSLVGYAIRLESKQSASTRLTYATTGVAMRLLERQDDLANINVLVIDEVHERNIDSDFLLIVLRRLLPRRPDLKVVLMSATIDAEKFATYLHGCPILMVPGRLFPVQTLFLEDAIEATNSLPVQQIHGMGDYEDTYNDDDDDISDTQSRLQTLQGYSEKTLSTLRRLNEYRIDFGLITKIALAISTQPEFTPYSKAILIFMPGIAEIRKLHQVMTSYSQFQKGWTFHILHSTVSTEDQQAAFQIPPPGIRKIVISTNIAETGVTIPDITAVVDTGKEKIMRFDERRQVSRLTESFISKASSRQRQGRAARVQEGLCVKLYTRDRFERLMPDHSTPEILRLSLSETILRVKLCSLGSIEGSLSEALDPPTAKNVRRAIEALKEEKVLTSSEDLTPLGQRLARLPLDIPLGKLVLNGVTFQCLDVMATIAALLSSKSPFIMSTRTTTTVDNIRRSFARGDSDLLLLFTAYESWKQAESNDAGATFCQKNLLSRQTLFLIEDQKIQLLSNLLDAGSLILNESEKASLQASRFKGRRRNFFSMPARYNSNRTNDTIINAAIALSFYPKLLRKEGKGWRNISTNQNVTISPQSINKQSSQQARWLSFYQTMQTKSHALTVSETSVVDETSIALLLGDSDCQLFSGTLTIDNNRMRFSVRTWKAILALREFRSKVRTLLIEGVIIDQRSEEEQQWLDLFHGLYK